MCFRWFVCRMPQVRCSETITGRQSMWSNNNLYSLRTLLLTTKITVRRQLARVWEKQWNSSTTTTRRNNQLSNSVRKARAYPVITVSSDSEPRLKNWKLRVFRVQMALGTFLFVLLQVAGRQPGDDFGAMTETEHTDSCGVVLTV